MKHRSLVDDYLSKSNGCGIYRKYPDVSDREKWDSLSEELKRELIKAGEEAQKEPWTQLFISDFREFAKSGNRLKFEDKYFPRRRKLNSLVMAECVENKGRFLEDILDGLYLILEETTWCLPAHNSYIRDTKQETMPDITRPIIDLFDAESGAEVAFAEYLLRPVLAKISPFISGYVNERLKERIFTPYLHQHFWWMGNGKEPMCNWTPWCTQNVLICALTRPSDFFLEEERRVFLEKAAVSCDYFLDEYGEDGGCDEGAQYYSHAALCLFGCLELISGALHDQSKARFDLCTEEDFKLSCDEHSDACSDIKEDFDGIFSEDIIKNVANYIVKMYVGNGYYVNFADCSALPGRRTAREYLFGKATGDEVLSKFAALDFQSESREEKLILDEINLFYHCMQAFSYDVMMAVKGKAGIPEDAFFESVGLMVARDEHYTLAAKAGDNADSHNHNDVGSFTVYKDGKPFVIDLGVGTYTQKTFSDKRYEIWTMQSQFHNLPTFIDASGQERNIDKACDKIVPGNDPASDVYNSHFVMQRDGERFAATDVNCILCCNAGFASDNQLNDKINSGDHISDLDVDKYVSSLAMDIAGAYGDERIRSYKRIASLVKGQAVVIEDSYDGDLEYVLSLMTYEKPEILRGKADNDKSVSIAVGNVGTIVVDGAESATIEAYQIKDERLALAWKHEVYRILLKMGSSKQRINLWIQ